MSTKIEVRPCRTCRHYRPGTAAVWCVGPHADYDVVHGFRMQELPGARYWNPCNYRLPLGVIPCGESGRNWTPKRKPVRDFLRRLFKRPLTSP